MTELEQLRALPKLQKTHYSWRIKPFDEDMMKEFIRITGGCSLSATNMADWNTVIPIGKSMNASFAINHSPLHFYGSTGIDDGPNYYKELIEFYKRINKLKNDYSVEPDMCLFDYEKFVPKNEQEVKMLAQKLNTFVFIAKYVFPNIKTSFYNHGGWRPAPNDDLSQEGLAPFPYLPMELKSDYKSVVLYSPYNSRLMREYVRRTSKDGTINDLVAWISIGSCWEPRPRRWKHATTLKKDFWWGYGGVLNNSWYTRTTKRIDRFGHYKSIGTCAIYPAPMRNPEFFKYFIEYVKGAHAI